VFFRQQFVIQTFITYSFPSLKVLFQWICVFSLFFGSTDLSLSHFHSAFDSNANLSEWRVGFSKFTQVSCSIDATEMVALMGPSGAGKTTLLNCMVGRSAGGVMQGAITYNAQQLSKVRANIGYVTQESLGFCMIDRMDIFRQGLTLAERWYSRLIFLDSFLNYLGAALLRRTSCMRP